MKTITAYAVLVTTLAPVVCCGQLRETAIANHIMDGFQTSRISEMPRHREANDLIRPYIESNPLIAAYFVTTGFLAYRFMESLPAKERGWAYAIWAWEAIRTTARNHRSMGFGSPVLVYSTRF